MSYWEKLIELKRYSVGWMFSKDIIANISLIYINWHRDIKHKCVELCDCLLHRKQFWWESWKMSVKQINNHTKGTCFWMKLAERNPKVESITLLSDSFSNEIRCYKHNSENFFNRSKKRDCGTWEKIHKNLLFNEMV